MCPIHFNLAFAGTRDPDHVDALVSDQLAQIGQWREEGRPQRVGAGALGLGDTGQAELGVLGADQDAEPVTGSCVQRVGKRGGDQHLVDGEILTQGGPSVRQLVAAERALSGRIETDQDYERFDIAAVEVDHRAGQLDSRLHTAQ